jgi:hypothetical protein
MWHRIQSLTFFSLFYLYLWLHVELHLIYGGGGAITNFPVFFKGWAFCRPFLSYPGGIVEYICAFLSQLFYYSWSGAIVVTLQAWLICACTGYFLEALNAPRLRLARFIGPILLLITYGQYTYHFVSTMALLAALFFVCLYLTEAQGQSTEGRRLPSVFRPQVFLCLGVFLVLSVILYAIAGGAFMLFAVVCGLYELLFERRRQTALLYFLSVAVVPYLVGVVYFGVSATDAFSNLLPFSWRILGWTTRKNMIAIIYILYLFLPLTALILGLWQIWGRQPKSEKPETKNSRGPLPHAVRWTFESLILFAVAAAAALFCHNGNKKTLLAVHYYACNEMWPQVLQAARDYPYSIFVTNAVNRALYHTGRLGYDMFCYPQHPDALLQTGEDRALAYWHKFDTQMDLGLMNMAQKNLTECMEVYGAQPMILKRLALINMVKGNIPSARIYLGALSRTLFCADWARDYLARLDSDPNLAGDDQIQRLRRLSLDSDDISLFYARDKALSALLERNRQNRMAFEYLMAWYLLNRRLDEFIQNIKRLNDFDYPQAPRLYEEAILIYVYGTRKPVYLEGYQVSPQARQQIEQFTAVYNRYARNKQAAFNELAQAYGDGYLFYHLYGFSGVK